MDGSERVVRRYDELVVEIHEETAGAGEAAAEAAEGTLAAAIERTGRARVVFATGTSQLAFFAGLRAADGVDWGRVEAFHMDEYLGIHETHPAGFRAFLRRELVEPLGIGTFHGIDGDPGRAQQTAERYARRLAEAPIDLCCMGIGENGHLAFNDPPVARFDDPEDVKVVPLDEASRRQQVGEGHFGSLDEVPTHALTLTIPALLRASRVQVLAPEARKAEAVRAALEGPVEERCPASILRRTPHATLYLDAASGSRLSRG
jgi:glucosamine-6-phosphate deaminase